MSYNTSTDALEVVNKFVLFNYNFPPDFIDKIWSGNFAMHFKSKWKMHYDRAGEDGVLFAFYINLDGNNRKLLLDYIMNNYKG